MLQTSAIDKNENGENSSYHMKTRWQNCHCRVSINSVLTQNIITHGHRLL